MTREGLGPKLVALCMIQTLSPEERSARRSPSPESISHEIVLFTSDTADLDSKVEFNMSATLRPNSSYNSLGRPYHMSSIDTSEPGFCSSAA